MAFEYRNQPWKTLYFAVNIVFLLFAKIPFYAFLYAFPAARPRKSWSLARSLFVLFSRSIVEILWSTTLPAELPVEKLADEKGAKKNGFVSVEPIPPDYIAGEVKQIAERNRVFVARVGGFWYGKRASDGSPGQKAEENEKVVYHIHGGGFVIGSAKPSNPQMKMLFDGLVQHLPSNPRVFALEYRLSSALPFKPANPFPAALLDALAGYRYLIVDLGFSPSNVIISGDSAGGTIAFWLARYLAMNKFLDLPNAGGLLLLSPTLDWALTQNGPSSSMSLHATSDYVEKIVQSRYSLRALLGDIPESEASKNVWVAPGSVELEHTPGLFAGLPKTCFLVGGAEQTLDGMVVLKDRLIVDLGKENVAWLEFPDGTHDFLALPFHEPERTQAYKDISKWAEDEIWPAAQV